MSTPPTPDLPAEAAARVTFAVHVIDLDLAALGLPEMTIDTAIGPAAVTPVGVRLSFENDDDDMATSVRINGRTGGLYLDYYHLAEGYRWPAWLTGLVEEHRPANRAAVRTAALTEAADAAAATWTGDDTPEEDRPGYDGATIDPEDRLRDAIDPEVGPERREQLITEYRDMVVGEIAGELRRLAAVPTTTTED